MPQVSVLLTVKNVEKYILACLNSILNQTFTDFEVVIIDEFNSNDQTEKIVKSLKKENIRYFKNEQFLGIPRSRNLSIKYAKGDFLFFTDGDCVVSKNWIEQGLMKLEDNDCAGVEGKSYYVTENYKPTFSDHTYGSKPGRFMTNNIAYKKRIVEMVGGFDERYTYHEDRALALQIKKTFRIKFNPGMNVFVQKENVSFSRILKQAPRIKNRVYLFKDFCDKELISWRIVDITNLMKLICPPIVFGSLLLNKFNSSSDYNLVPFTYVRAFLERLRLWQECARNRVFLV